MQDVASLRKPNRKCRSRGQGKTRRLGITEPQDIRFNRGEKRMIKLRYTERNGGKRALFDKRNESFRITAHCPYRHKLCADDQQRVTLLEELSHIQEIDIAGTSELFATTFSITPPGHDAEYGRATYERRTPESHTTQRFGLFPHYVENRLRQELGTSQLEDVLSSNASLRVPIVDAHIQSERDVLVTSEPDLVDLGLKMKNINIVDPQTGLRLVGLYLASRNVYITHAGAGMTSNIPRDLFYRIEATRVLPHTVTASIEKRGWTPRAEQRDENPRELLVTTITRCTMMLKAKDEIGMHFYREQTPETAYDLVDNFDRFTLQLSGALDALAKAVRNSLGISRLRKQQVNFRNDAFKQEVKCKASEPLRDILDDPEFEAFQTVLAELRNSIHNVAAVPQYGENNAEPPVLSVALDDNKVAAAAAKLKQRVDLGIRRTPIDTTVAPYTCATGLVGLALKYIDGISRGIRDSRVKRVERGIDRWPYDSETANRVRLLHGY